MQFLRNHIKSQTLSVLCCSISPIDTCRCRCPYVTHKFDVCLPFGSGGRRWVPLLVGPSRVVPVLGGSLCLGDFGTETGARDKSSAGLRTAAGMRLCAAATCRKCACVRTSEQLGRLCGCCAPAVAWRKAALVCE